MHPQTTPSAFAEFAASYIEFGISVLPIAPNTKKPGRWSQADGWQGMGDWTRYNSRVATDIELAHMVTWPDAGIGMTCGGVSRIVCCDIDYEIPGHANLIRELVPWSPVVKKGEKGETRFFLANGEKSMAFNVQGVRVLDILSDGRQTVLPPTVHPSGCNYVWLSKLSLLEFCKQVGLDALPTLPATFAQDIEAELKPYQTEADRKFQRSFTAAPRDDAAVLDTSLSIQGEFFREVNREALARIDEWVPQLIQPVLRVREGYRAIATWRGCENPNVGITPMGIRDWGGEYGMTPIDLVMNACGLRIMDAVGLLRETLGLRDPEPIVLTAAAATTPASAAPKLLPWQKPAAAKPEPMFLPPTTSDQPAAALPGFLADPPGMLGEIARWITDTAPKAQPELAVAAALALCATATQRIYRSNRGNFTSLYMVMVAKSTEGKEHPQGCVERALVAAGLDNLLMGSGYTSAGAVYSALLLQPSHIVIMDELGKLLKLSRSHGNANGEAAIDKLVEAYGKLDGTMVPSAYSTMSLSQAAATDVQPGKRKIHNPAITLLGATTPGTFYGALTDDLVHDGFLGRLLVIESTRPRQLVRSVDQTPPPKDVVDWLRTVANPKRGGNLAALTTPEIGAHVVPMTIDSACDPMLQAFEKELNDLKDKLEPEGLDVLAGRSYEKALRIAMIVALAMDPAGRWVRTEHLAWGIAFVRHFDTTLITSVRSKRIRNSADGDMKRAIEYIKGASAMAPGQKPAVAAVMAQGLMPKAVLLKRMHMKASDFGQLMTTLHEMRVVESVVGVDGYAGVLYRVLAD